MSEYINSIHHIGYLVKNIEKSILEFKSLGYDTISDITYDNIRDIDICFMKNNGYCIELVCPCSNKSIVYSLLKKLGEGPYHICYEVNNIDKSSEILREKGYFPLGEKIIAPALDNRLVIFFQKKYVGMIELVEKNM